MARLYNGAESPNRCVYCYKCNLSFVIGHLSFVISCHAFKLGISSELSGSHYRDFAIINIKV